MWAWSTDRSWRWASLSAYVDRRRATCVTLPRFDSAMAARSSWWFVRGIATSPDRLVGRLLPNMKHSAFHWGPRSLVRVVT